MKGFTLIETLLYIALLSMLLTGGVTTAFQLLKSTSTDSSQLASYDETVFVLQKISWVLSQTGSSTQILSPTIGMHSDVLSVISQNGSHITLCVATGKLFIYEGTRTGPLCGDAAFTSLTHIDTVVSAFDVYMDPSHIVRIAITLNGTQYTTTTYVP